ncbi:hypothetical protein Enr10x_54030 [Gimesia panareensis]|uniref:Uncharacterized protein n=1 Tax=Gimesia panareensis TaxID=2527978 RepID=A0A517QEL1_9PLAN|nr:hypothetical protein Enr10x_54030 [Gimesia panareensis]
MPTFESYLGQEKDPSLFGTVLSATARTLWQIQTAICYRSLMEPSR